VVYPLINSKMISKLARYFAIVSFIFVIFMAIVTFYLLQIASPSAPISYNVVIILSNITPYLFIAALSVVISVIAGKVETETPATEEVQPEKEELPPVVAKDSES
jgi:hypothetical protein